MQESSDIFGKAFKDYLEGDNDESIEVGSDIAETSILPVSYFFRDFNNMPEGEKKVLNLCKGSVLDVGAGAGCHSLFLQNKGCDVTAIDNSKGATEVIIERGVKKVFCVDFFEFNKGKYDNILFLMNGAGVAQTISGLSKLFRHSKSLLNQNGSIYIESSDLIYMYEQPDGSIKINLNDNYYGEVEYSLKYKNIAGKPFKWLYVDIDNMINIAEKSGLKSEVIYSHDYNYIMRVEFGK